ncbi:methyltransferase [Actinoplanes sp. NPDC051513]|uniref:methyltransferase n=1 Tax=Actinoplanes sp. NPDC051513 TaxID=3363908 RepID=UPI0037B7749B
MTYAATPAELVFSMLAAKTVAAAVDAGVVDLLAERPQTVEQLTRRGRLHGSSSRRLLRALVGLGLVTQPAPDRYALTAMGRLLLPEVPGSQRALLQARCGPEFWHAWSALESSIRTGTTAWELAHGAPWLAYYKKHPDRWAIFNAHMSQHTRDAAPGIVTATDYSRFHIIVDLGGGDGTLITAILRAHQDLRGVVFDLPEVVAAAPAVLAAAGVANRADVVAGDFFTAVPEGADAYLMKFILHDWDDERAATILRNCRAAMPLDGRVLIVERVLPEQVGAADVADLLSDMLMMVATGGKERTEHEYRDLLGAAGLTLTAVSEPLPPFGYRLIEASATVSLVTSPPRTGS